MATPTWNQITAPNFSAGNYLIAQAMEQLDKATTGFKSIADQYKDTVQKRNLGLIQEYVNSAKSPEELQSEAFQTGLTNITRNMGGDYDTLAKAQLVDKAYDSLLSRKANQVSIASNEFNLDSAKQTKLTKEYTNKILVAPPEQRDALRQAAIAAGAFDYAGVVSGDLNAAQLIGATQQNKLRDATWDDQVKAFKLANNKTIAETEDIKTNNDIAWYNALTQRAQAEAAAEKAAQEKKNSKNSYIASGLAAIDTATKDIDKQVYGSGLNTDPEKSWKKWHEKATEGIGLFGGKADAAPNTLVKLIDNHPVLKKLPDNLKILHAENALREVRDSEWLTNPIGFTSGSEDALYKKALERSYADFQQQATKLKDNATIPLYRKMVFEHAQKTGANGYAAAKDLGLDELTIYKSGIASPLTSQAKLKYAGSDKSIPEDQFIENEINIATNPDYASLNKPLFPKPKQEAANVPAQSSSSFLNKLGTSSSAEKAALINEQMKQTNDPIQIAFLTNELKKLEKGVPPVTANTSNSLQEQQQRMEAAALARLTAAALKQNGQPPVTPTITAKPEEFKPRELTPAEKQQAERMNQEALVRLTGAKLTEEQAKAQKQFPTTPLKVLANAVKPVPSPLIPVESQNAYKVKENNLSINLSTGKSVPSKDPVPMPNVSWGKPAEVVTMNPIVAKLPQYKAVATFVGDGDTFSAKSDSYATKGEKAKKAGGILCRVDSVDAPETEHKGYGSFKGKLGQPYGEEAGKKLRDMILNKEISIRIVRPASGDPNEPGLYGRDICQIEVEGANVSTELIRAGAAWLYREYNYYFTGLETVEANAKAEGRGLFSNPNAVYPQTAKHNGSLNLR